jgi:hypothetical protein
MAMWATLDLAKEQDIVRLAKAFHPKFYVRVYAYAVNYSGYVDRRCLIPMP